MDTLETARRLVAANRYMTLATADSDGRPWASPGLVRPGGRRRVPLGLGPESEALAEHRRRARRSRS